MRSEDPNPPPSLRRPSGYYASNDLPGPSNAYGNQLLIDYLLAMTAAGVYENPLHGELTRHYVFGGGAVFHLDRRRMTQVIRPGSNHLDVLGGRQWREIEPIKQSLIEPATRAGTASATVRTNAVVVCDENLPSLGAFTAFIEGTITAHRGNTLPATQAATIELLAPVHNTFSYGPDLVPHPAPAVRPDHTYYEFRGTMHWEDEWNFDPQTPDPHGFPSTRTPGAEWATRMAHNHLPGMPFHVRSDTVQVSQMLGFPGALW
ncbi:hypothetical protein ACW9HJ_26225 [Nocardia gipuzkoensis]